MFSNSWIINAALGVAIIIGVLIVLEFAGAL